MWTAQSGCGYLFASAAIHKGDDYRTPDRGRDSALDCATPPSEPDMRISRIRLSSWWFYLKRTVQKYDRHTEG